MIKSRLVGLNEAARAADGFVQTAMCLLCLNSMNLLKARLFFSKTAPFKSRSVTKSSGAKFISGPCAFGLSGISDQAASTAFQSSGTVAERTPNLPVLN